MQKQTCKTTSQARYVSDKWGHAPLSHPLLQKSPLDSSCGAVNHPRSHTRLQVGSLRATPLEPVFTVSACLAGWGFHMRQARRHLLHFWHSPSRKACFCGRGLQLRSDACCCCCCKGLCRKHDTMWPRRGKQNNKTALLQKETSKET